MQIKQADNFPVISRSGRTSEELKSIIGALLMSSKDGKPYLISNIEFGNKYNSMQQRIRAQAKKLNLKVQIHFDKSNETLYFIAHTPISSEIENAKKPIKNSAKSKDIKNPRVVSKK